MGWLWWRLASAASTRSRDASKASSPASPQDSLNVYQASTTPLADTLEQGTTFRAPPGDAARPTAATTTSPASPSKGHHWCTFIETYGRFTGPGLVVGVLVALVWTALLLCINIAPTWTINRLFNTRAIDDGEFWLLGSPASTHPTATAFVVAGLALVAVYYLYLLFLLTWKRKDVTIVDDFVAPLTPSRSTCLCDLVTRHFSELDAESRPYLKVSEELPEIAYQTVLLAVYMDSGLSPGLVLFVATVIALNCFVRCYRVLVRETYHERNDSLANLAFQFFFAVLLPVVLLVCALTSFVMNVTSYAIRVDHFAVGSFERLARFAQPDAYIRTHTTSKLLVELLILSDKTGLAIATLGMHLALIWRCHDIVLGCLLGFKKQRLPLTGAIAQDDSLISLVRIVKAVYWLGVKLLLGCLCVSKRLIPKVFAFVLFGYGVGILFCTSMGVIHSRRACESFAGRCVLHAIEFRGVSADKDEVCPCIAYVNQPTSIVTSWSRWSNRLDATEDLRRAAASSRLQIVQIVDRDLGTLPDAVSDCTYLRELVLVRTALQALPPWLAELEELQLLHLAGDVNTTFDAFPVETEFFREKIRLRSVRLENLRALSRLPSLPENAHSIVLVDLPWVHSIPLMGHLHELRVLVLSQMVRLQRLPLLPDRLETLHVEMPSAVCCNGYLGDDPALCTTNASSVSRIATQCHAHNAQTNLTTACLASDTLTTTQSIATQRWLDETNFQCASEREASSDTQHLRNAQTANTITQASVAACDGQLYRECSLTWPIVPADVTSGVCLGAARLQIVHCAPKDARYEAMRRAEIRLGVSACDAEAEQWQPSHYGSAAPPLVDDRKRNDRKGSWLKQRCA